MPAFGLREHRCSIQLPLSSCATSPISSDLRRPIMWLRGRFAAHLTRVTSAPAADAAPTGADFGWGACRVPVGTRHCCKRAASSCDDFQLATLAEGDAERTESDHVAAGQEEADRSVTGVSDAEVEIAGVVDSEVVAADVAEPDVESTAVGSAEAEAADVVEPTLK